jgi:hypothetical protein
LDRDRYDLRARFFVAAQSAINLLQGDSMPRDAAVNLDTAVREAMEPVIQRASVQIARAIAEMAAERLDAQLQAGVQRAGGRDGGRRQAARSARPRSEVTRWAADRRARRVPNFVIEQTGLKTKQQIVSKYGEGVVFEKNRPPPRAKA